MVCFLGELSVCNSFYLKGLLSKMGGGNGEMLFLYAYIFAGKKFIVSLHKKGKPTMVGRLHSFPHTSEEKKQLPLLPLSQIGH